MAVKINGLVYTVYPDFLSRLCGGEACIVNLCKRFHFLSRLCGGEADEAYSNAFIEFLSRLCGGEVM